jgi:hypothetical protein
MPPLPGKKLIDPVLLARNKLRMSFNSLDKVAEHLGVNSKTEVRLEMWLRAALDGDRRAMSYIVEHCVQDVLVLEKVKGRHGRKDDPAHNPDRNVSHRGWPFPHGRETEPHSARFSWKVDLCNSPATSDADDSSAEWAAGWETRPEDFCSRDHRRKRG